MLDALMLRNETLKSIQNRRSIRMFSEQPVTDEDVTTLLHAANLAPSAHNSQSWKFTVLKGAKKAELAALVSAAAATMEKPSNALLRMGARSITSAPVVIAISNTGELIEHGTELFKVNKDLAHDFFRTMEIQNSAAAVENLLLAATSLGLGAVWMGILFLLKKEVLDFLGEPQGEFMAVIPVGWPLKDSAGPAKRPLDVTVKYLE